MESALAAIYEAAVLEVHLPEGTATFDRSGQLSGPPVDESFGCITAWNPGHERMLVSENEAANARLAADIDTRGWRRLDAVGRDPANTYSEPSFAVFTADQETLLELAREFRQAAIFWWDGSRLCVLWC